MGGSSGKSKSSSGGGFQADVWGPQGDALKGLYQSAANMYGNAGNYMNPIKQSATYAANEAGRAGRYAGDMMRDAYSRGSGMQESGFGTGMQGAQQMLGGGAIGDTGDIRGMLMESLAQPLGRSNVGSMYESIVGGPGNTYIDPMVDAMKRSAGENLQTLQNQTAMQAAAAGQPGSSRHAMQNAMQSAAINQDVLDREMEMRGGAYDKDLAMKMDIARQADTNMLQNRQQTQQNLMNMLGQSDANVRAGMGFGGDLASMGQQAMAGGGAFGQGYGQTMQNLGMGTMAPFLQAQQSGFAPLQQYANVLGGPQLIGQGQLSGKSKGLGTSGGVKG